MMPRRPNSALVRFFFAPVNEEQLQRHRQDVAEKLARFNDPNLR